MASLNQLLVKHTGFVDLVLTDVTVGASYQVNFHYRKITSEGLNIDSIKKFSIGFLKKQNDRNSENRKSSFNRYFSAEKNSETQKILREAGMNSEGVPTLENAAFEFTSPGGRKFLIISLEFAPRDTTIQWAKQASRIRKKITWLSKHWLRASSFLSLLDY